QLAAAPHVYASVRVLSSNDCYVEVVMKRAIFGFLTIAAAGLCQQPPGAGEPPKVRDTMASRTVAQGHKILPLGSEAPDFALPGIDGKIHKLREYSNSPVLMVVFT